MFQPLQTARLSIERLTSSHSAAMFRYRSDPDVSRYQSWQPTSAAEVRAFIESLSAIGMDSPGKWVQVGIVLRETGELIGDVGIRTSDPDSRQAELGISLAPAFHRRGLATEAFEAVLAFLFRDQQTHRVFCSVDPRNTASLALLRGVGMRQEAHHVESYWFRGAWADDVVFAMLSSEWNERHAS